MIKNIQGQVSCSFGKHLGKENWPAQGCMSEKIEWKESLAAPRYIGQVAKAAKSCECCKWDIAF